MATIRWSTICYGGFGTCNYRVKHEHGLLCDKSCTMCHGQTKENKENTHG